MMNRAEQTWPEGMVIELDGDKATLLAPFGHELNTSGASCDTDCPACLWAVQSSMEVR